MMVFMEMELRGLYIRRQVPGTIVRTACQAHCCYKFGKCCMPMNKTPIAKGCKDCLHPLSQPLWVLILAGRPEFANEFIECKAARKDPLSEKFRSVLGIGFVHNPGGPCEVPAGPELATAEAEKDCFNSVLKLAIGDKISSSAMQTVYEKINEFKETADEGSVPTVDARTLEKIVVESGINLKQPIHMALEEVMYKSHHDFKISNIIPDIDAKSLTLSNEKTSITIAPKDLNSIRQVRDKNGKKCLLIEISDDVTINGFTLETEDSIDEAN